MYNSLTNCSLWFQIGYLLYSKISIDSFISYILDLNNHHTYMVKCNHGANFVLELLGDQPHNVTQQLSDRELKHE